MSDRIIVLVSGLDDASHGEVSILENADQAARFVETLLESGFEQERVRIFGGDELQMQVHHRPVVSLLNQNPSKNGSGQKDDLVQSEAALQSDVEEEALVQKGVRFSSLFKPA